MDGFGAGWAGPLLITVDFGADSTPAENQAASTELRAELAATDGVSAVTPPRLGEDGATALFLLSRVKEELACTGNPDRAVRNGLAATARVILAAASVMVVVFGSFILNDQRTVTMFGFGLAMAIAVYGLVVMLVLVPALLAIAGRAAWGHTKRRSSAEPEPARARGRPRT